MGDIGQSRLRNGADDLEQVGAALRQRISGQRLPWPQRERIAQFRVDKIMVLMDVGCVGSGLGETIRQQLLHDKLALISIPSTKSAWPLYHTLDKRAHGDLRNRTGRGFDDTQIASLFPDVGDRSTSSRSQPPKPLCRTLPRLLRFLLSVARRGARLQAVDEAARHFKHLVDRVAKGGLIDLRGRVDATQLAHELERGGADLIIGRRRIEIEQCRDTAAHDPAPT